MQDLYGKLGNCVDEHLLTINKDKTKCDIFGNRQDEPMETIELNGDVLQVVKVFKYLGHSFF